MISFSSSAGRGRDRYRTAFKIINAQVIYLMKQNEKLVIVTNVIVMYKTILDCVYLSEVYVRV